MYMYTVLYYILLTYAVSGMEGYCNHIFSMCVCVCVCINTTSIKQLEIIQGSK